ncbi:transcriptional regulator [Chroococcidiopsis sp. CCALA 051]|uniref:metal-sensitive transcriptional regulator n=1 Tax=Chroococcidiopsis sp. CCALA 051 TaxID=869949 RepID=UPI000D0D7A65|nr:metal-sensitive transcriptional regulator [Chroococcidiopsis sp. CCALA 051]PSM49614.1 transcriptional regulator [Chroococcidiopsis sp. CCALA 051]
MPRTQNQKILNRLARIEGHVQAIQRTIEADRSCPEVLMQIVAERAALKKVALILLEDFAEQRLADVMPSDNFKSERSDLFKALNLLS